MTVKPIPIKKKERKGLKFFLSTSFFVKTISVSQNFRESDGKSA